MDKILINKNDLATRPGLEQIHPYQPGNHFTTPKGENQPDWIRLNANECAWGTSPQAQKAFHQNNLLHHYPDGGAGDLRKAIGQKYSLDPERIICGAGSDELINLLCQAYLCPGEESLYSQYGFLLYKISSQAAGGQARAVGENNFSFAVAAFPEILRPNTKIVFLANPNNPTGSCLSATALRQLHARLPKNILLVIDAAYAEYVTMDDYDAGIGLAAGYENVVMTRTFSKIYGLGGLRVGWAYGPAAIVAILNRIRGPFNVNAPAQAAAIAALGDGEWLQQVKKNTIAERDNLLSQLQERKISCLPSQGNFVLVRFGRQKASLLHDFLRENGLLVRQMHAYGLDQYLRITIGTKPQNRRFIALLDLFCKQAQAT